MFESNKIKLDDGIPRHRIDDVLHSFRWLWPDNILPRRYYDYLSKVLLCLARDDDAAAARDARTGGDPDDTWNKNKGEKLVQFMRTVRGEFASHLRQFYSQFTDKNWLNSVSDLKPNRTPDEL